MSENFGAVITNKEHTLVAIEAAQACWDRRSNTPGPDQ